MLAICLLSFAFRWLHLPLDKTIQSMPHGRLAESTTHGAVCLWVANIHDSLFNGAEDELHHVEAVLFSAFKTFGMVVGHPYIRKKMGDATSARQKNQSWAVLQLIPFPSQFGECESQLLEALNRVEVHGETLVVKKQVKKRKPITERKRSAKAAAFPYFVALSVGVVSFYFIWALSSDLHSGETAEWVLDFVLSLLLKWVLYEPLSKSSSIYRTLECLMLTVRHAFVNRNHSDVSDTLNGTSKSMGVQSCTDD